MPAFDECCVLIPASTLEDFPTDLSDADARSLLAAWTVLWHPALLAHCQQMPIWYRADAPPEPAGKRLFALPDPSEEKLPEGYRRRSQGDSTWISGPDRAAMLQSLVEQLRAKASSDAASSDAAAPQDVSQDPESQAASDSPAPDPPPAGPVVDVQTEPAAAETSAETSPAEASFPPEWLDRLADASWPALQGAHRSIGVEDFYAAAFATLQIQVMTRRLRYTSNLDEIHLQSRLLAAAQSFVGGQAQAAIDALHDVFDALAEERDHYFSSDPHLIDLTLLTPSTLDACLDQLAQLASPPAAQSTANTATASAAAAGDADSGREQANDTDSDASEQPAAPFGAGEAPLATPRNVLIDCAVAEALSQRGQDSRVDELRELLRSQRLGWAGGGPTDQHSLDAMTMAQAETVFVDAWKQTRDAVGQAPPVYGRFAGSTPADLTRTLGYRGMIPLDFAGGTGHGDEAKVILQSAGAELEALTVKPIDASGDSAFLNIGARLGEAIDSGEIATALLAHWPGQSCTALEDLRRVACWSLCLGRFWKLDDYFTAGEHPYHHGSTDTTASDAWRDLETLVQQKTPDPISGVAHRFRERVKAEQQAMLSGMASLVAGEVSPDTAPAQALAAAVTRQGGSDQQKPQAVFLANPHSIGCRHTVTIHSPAVKNAPARSSASKSAHEKSAGHIYAVTGEGRQSVATVDIPGCGFVIAQGVSRSSGASSLGSRLKRTLLGGPKPIAEAGRLQNEFMEITFGDDSGGITGVYSGGTRGNRFSMRLIRNQSGGSRQGETVMRLERQKILVSTPSIGCIEARGEIAEANDGAALAHFVLRYTLQRGSRFVKVDGELSPVDPIHGDPWYEYYAARVAVPTEAALFRALVRDKVHRCRSRRIVAPLGLVIDEAERQTLVTAAGLPFHRRSGDRFLDTLLRVQGETNATFSLAYGFDVPAPVAAARSLIAPPVEVPIEPADGLADVGWMVHAAPKDLLLTTLAVDRRDDGSLAAIVRVIQTRPRNCKATLRFFRNVAWAMPIEGTDKAALNLPRPEQQEANPSEMTVKEDAVAFALPSHGISDLLVVFKDA